MKLLGEENVRETDLVSKGLSETVLQTDKRRGSVMYGKSSFQMKQLNM